MSYKNELVKAKKTDSDGRTSPLASIWQGRMVAIGRCLKALEIVRTLCHPQPPRSPHARTKPFPSLDEALLKDNFLGH